jgi:hypothetical protein
MYCTYVPGSAHIASCHRCRSGTLEDPKSSRLMRGSMYAAGRGSARVWKSRTRTCFFGIF